MKSILRPAAILFAVFAAAFLLLWGLETLLPDVSRETNSPGTETAAVSQTAPATAPRTLPQTVPVTEPETVWETETSPETPSETEPETIPEVIA